MKPLMANICLLQQLSHNFTGKVSNYSTSMLYYLLFSTLTQWPPIRIYTIQYIGCSALLKAMGLHEEGLPHQMDFTKWVRKCIQHPVNDILFIILFLNQFVFATLKNVKLYN